MPYDCKVKCPYCLAENQFASKAKRTELHDIKAECIHCKKGFIVHKNLSLTATKPAQDNILELTLKVAEAREKLTA